MAQFRFDIGLPDEDTPSLPILIDGLARQILTLIPSDQRQTALRAINNASDLLSKIDDDWAEMQVIRANDGNGNRLDVTVTIKELEDDDDIATHIITGRIAGPGYHVRGSILRLHHVPTSCIAAGYEGRDVTELADISILKGMKIARTTTATAAGKTSLEAHLDVTRVEFERFLHKWLTS